MSDQLKQLLDQSHCLTKRQMKDYASGIMTREEAHAVEQHLNACPFCSAAVDGMAEHWPLSGEALAELNNGFLKEHFGNIHPDIHLNSIAPAAAAPPPPHRKRRIHYSPLQMTGIAAGIILFFAAVWYVEFGHEKHSTQVVAQGLEAAENGVISRDGGSSAPPSLMAPSPSSDRAVAKEKTEDELRKTEAATMDQPVAAMAEPVEPAAEKVAETKELSERANAAAAYNKTNDASTYSAPPQLATGNMAKVEDLAGDKNKDQKFSNELAKKAAPAGATRFQADTVESAVATRSKGDREPAPAAAPDPISRGKALLESRNYAAALTVFQKEMNTGDAAHREEATYYVARCYAAMGQKTAARRLLQQLSESRSSQRKAAEKLLEEVDSVQSR